MISGTAKETAALALARMGAMLKAGIDPQTAFDHAQRVQRLAERRELVAQGKLPGASALPFVVPLDIDMVDVIEGGPPVLMVTVDHRRVDYCHHRLTQPIRALLEGICDGYHDLWFVPAGDDAGHARMSFLREDDATLFKCAIGGAA